MTDPWLQPPEGSLAAQAARAGAAIPALNTQRLRLRPPRLTDYPTYQAIFFDPRWPNGEAPDDPENAWLDFCEMTASWVLRGMGLLAIDDKASGELLGFVTLDHEWGDPEPEIGWFLIAEAEGQGVAFEAAKALLAHARELGLKSLVAYCDAANDRSVTLALRLGAIRDAEAEAALPAGTVVFRFRGPSL